MKNTGIPINFGLSVILGFMVGAAIAGMMFYNFTHDNIMQFGALKAMGKTVEFDIYPRGGHVMFEPLEEREMMGRNLEWFRKWIK